MANIFQNIASTIKRGTDIIGNLAFGDEEKRRVFQENIGQKLQETKEAGGLFVKELGAGTATARNIFASIARSFPREGAGAVLEVEQRTGRGILGGAPRAEFVPTTPVEKFLFGKEPVAPLSIQGKETLEAFGAPEKIAQPLGLPFGALMLGLDLTPMGGAKKTVTTLSKLNKAEDIIPVLKKIGVPDDFLADTAATIAKTTDEKTIEKILEKVGEAQKLQADDISKAKASGVSFDEWVKGQKKFITKEADTISIERFAGKDADIVPNQVTVSKSSVDFWKRKIQQGERPRVTIGYLPFRKSNTVLDGHSRLRAYKDLGIKDIPIEVQDKLKPTKSQLKAEWDSVRVEPQAVKGAEMPVRGVGEGVPIVPKTIAEFERLPFEKQREVFETLPESLQNQIMGVDIARFEGTPVETLAMKIASGETKIRAPKDIKTDVLETLGRGTYTRIFRKDTIYPTLDELASDAGISSSKLVEEIQGALQRRVELREGVLAAKQATRTEIAMQRQRNLASAKDIRANIAIEKEQKGLGGEVVARLKQKHGISEMKNAPVQKLNALFDDMRSLREGDSFLSKAQVNSLRRFGVNNTTTKREAAEILGDVAQWKDRNARFFNFFKTIDQKIEGVAGKDVERVKDILTRPRGESVKNMVREEIALKTEMRDMLSRLDVKDRGSRALIMRYGEGRMTMEELKSATPKWEQVIKADEWFRGKYEGLLNSTNEVLSKFYPKEKLIPKRKDYYTHAQELGFSWKELTSGGDINPALEQISEFTRPNRRFNPFTLMRKGGKEFVEDAAYAFESYLPPILNNKYITEDIVRHKAVADILAHKTLDSKNVNQFIFSLRDAANSLAGKTNPFDRALVNRVFGRQALRLIQSAQTRLSKNRILGSVGSALMQISGIPTSVSRNNIVRTSKGLLMQAYSPFLGKNDPILNSAAMLRRYGEKGLRPGERIFAPTAVEQVLKTGEKISSIPFEVIEKNISSAIWRASFDNAYSQGFRGAELMQKSDEIFSSIVGSRALGEKALAFESGVLSLPLQFQLEVNTFAQVFSEEVFSKIFKDPVKATRAAIEASITLFLFNTLFEKTLGRTPLPDPIRAIADASQRDTWGEKVGRIAGEGLSSVAGGQFVANLFPDNLRKKYFGRSEVGIYPGGIPVVQTVSKDFGELVSGRPGNFVYDFVLPYGGGQLKKILQGIDGLDKMGSYNTSGKLQFPINQNQWFQVITFGKYSTPQAREYFDKQRQPLSVKQTAEYFMRTQDGESPESAYGEITKERRANEYKREIVKKLVGKIKANPQEGFAIIQLWKSEGIIDSKMEQDILDGLAE